LTTADQKSFKTLVTLFGFHCFFLTCFTFQKSQGHSGPLWLSSRVLWEKIRVRAILKENMANYISLERLINVDFGKRIRITSILNSTEENCKTYRENDHASFSQINELIGYQNLADFCQIWPERSLDVVKPKRVGDF